MPDFSELIFEKSITAKSLLIKYEPELVRYLRSGVPLSRIHSLLIEAENCQHVTYDAFRRAFARKNGGVRKQKRVHMIASPVDYRSQHSTDPQDSSKRANNSLSDSNGERSGSWAHQAPEKHSEGLKSLNDVDQISKRPPATKTSVMDLMKRHQASKSAD